MKVAIWSSGVIAWVAICSGAWFVASRDDYARLKAATACFAAQPPAAAASCSGLRPTDILSAKASIDRKATLSRLAGAGGAMAALSALILSRRQKGA